MSQTITISRDEILHQIKLSCQIPSVVEGILTRKMRVATEEELLKQTGRTTGSETACG